MNEMGQLVTNLGFPIALVLILLWFLYKKVWTYLVEKMDKITQINEELVRTNRELCSSMNVKLGVIEDKVDRIASEIHT
ncbi:hypothetical protein PM004_08460 [Clostridium paraputrificum]|uniref:hypothetical protein n=1 Tax=Clostridium TaxID=1485 RepID=UPI00232B2134|nr:MULTISPECIES: hypothetical protein [Clostridium]MDB2089369.1 hypothetical protein [Clostridium paraputrificum]MDB2097728.1 hypothetical protein [Clostridium paraputrificum]MDU1180024.1 hypothetical protein [Clostridium sp.]MDU1228079.1 hypothetical protein [Clostridium sp.]MDU7654019.1 hypothetical protein [Clostridium sp.]